MHQIAELPHERLMAIDQRLSLFAVVVKPGRRHGGFDFFHRLLAIGDPRFEIRDLSLKFFRGLIALPLFGSLTFARFVL